MKKFTEEELKEILENHKLWLKNEKVGVRADLSGADLSWAKLSGANLSGADLTGADLFEISPKRRIKVYCFEQHTAIYLGKNEISIGCEVHSL